MIFNVGALFNYNQLFLNMLKSHLASGESIRPKASAEKLLNNDASKSIRMRSSSRLKKLRAKKNNKDYDNDKFGPTHASGAAPNDKKNN